MQLKEILERRIVTLDGGLGTVIQSYGLSESDFRAERFKSWNGDLMGCNDILSITQPTIIKEIHENYLIAGADIISTNTFNSNSVSMEDYGLMSNVYEMNYTSARLAKEAAQRYSTAEKPRFVAGSVGPTSKTLSISPDVERPAYRNLTFDELTHSYMTQIEGLLDGGVDIILIETIFDTLNAKAAIEAFRRVTIEREKEIPLMLSVTITDASGRTLSGQTLEAFVISVSHAHNLLSLGLNCSFGAEKLFSPLSELSSYTDKYISVHPNAGLPDGFGGYSHTPEKMLKCVEPYFTNNLVNIIGGCCGTTPEHIKLITERAAKATPRKIEPKTNITALAGLEPLKITKEINFVNIGERANVAGSAKFAKLIKNENFEEAIAIVKKQVEEGAQIIDICMDDAMIDAKRAMGEFVRLLASEPEISRVPLMIDSSDWTVILEGLKNTQGKPIVNSISLKEGDNDFLMKAHTVHSYGGAVVVMLFDEAGQADSYERKIAIAKRSYNLLVNTGFPKEDIIFDPNILSIATGIAEHDTYGIDFIRACEWIKTNLEGVKVSGGVSNLSFSFRGNNTVREAMHSVFLYHAKKAGMDMAIVNAGMLRPYDDIEKELLDAVEDVVLNRNSGATEQMIDIASKFSTKKTEIQENVSRDEDVEKRVVDALVKGDTLHIVDDIEELYKKIGSPLIIIEQILMSGMNIVGERFSTGKMFLPQVVKSARVMKKCVEVLNPYMNTSETTTYKKRRVVAATVKGDVHDIGKNIVSIVLACNGFEVIDLGVMTPTQKIIDTARDMNCEAILLSGLITPSLTEMGHVISEAKKEGFVIPIMVGGATTSDIHTAVKLAPLYDSTVVRTSDASECVGVLSKLLSSEKEDTEKAIKLKYATLREKRIESEKISLDQARQNVKKYDFSNIVKPEKLGVTTFNDIKISEVRELINWTFFFKAWEIKGRYPQIFDDPQKGVEAKKLFDDATAMLDELETNETIKLRGIIGLYEACSEKEFVFIKTKKQSCSCCDTSKEVVTSLIFDRKLEKNSKNLSCADFIAPRKENIKDYIGTFAVTAGIGAEELAETYRKNSDDYSAIMLKLLCDRLAEATAEYLHYKVRTELWGYAKDEKFEIERLIKENYVGIRPAFGYPCAPDHSQKKVIFDLMSVEKEIGISLTENYMMTPASSISGVMFAHEESCYF